MAMQSVQSTRRKKADAGRCRERSRRSPATSTFGQTSYIEDVIRSRPICRTNKERDRRISVGSHDRHIIDVRHFLDLNRVKAANRTQSREGSRHLYQT